MQKNRKPTNALLNFIPVQSFSLLILKKIQSLDFFHILHTKN